MKTLRYPSLFLITVIILLITGCQSNSTTPKARSDKSAAELLGNPDFLAMSYGGYRTKTREVQPSLEEIKEDLMILDILSDIRNKGWCKPVVPGRALMRALMLAPNPFIWPFIYRAAYDMKPEGVIKYLPEDFREELYGLSLKYLEYYKRQEKCDIDSITGQLSLI